MAERREINYETAQSYTEDIPIHLAIYAKNGVGKTTLAGTTGLKTVLLDCSDSGAITLRRANPQGLRIIRITSILQYLDVIDDVNRKAKEIDLLVVDTVTGLQSIAVAEVKGKRKFEMNQRKWGQVGSRIIECVTETRNFPKDVIYLIQEKKFSGGDDEPDEIGPALTPSVKGYLSGNIDWIGRYYLDEDKRKLDFRLSDTLEAKDRAGTFPKVCVSPTYLGIRNKILKQLKGE